ncbi:hypothetical protein R1A27_04770 [Methylobacterium sp. NMS12]|uniref:hypothetical protein n=1 Tax=Methylobacterium sp. NMS12 TaxID=3079766 RepID=UPI003F881DC3
MKLVARNLYDHSGIVRPAGYPNREILDAGPCRLNAEDDAPLFLVRDRIVLARNAAHVELDLGCVSHVLSSLVRLALTKVAAWVGRVRVASCLPTSVFVAPTEGATA